MINIKMRIWDAAHTIMRYVEPLQSVKIFSDGSGMLIDSDYNDTVICDFAPEWLDKKNKLMLSSGLVDKGAKLIYQDDIIKDNTGKLYRVYLMGGGFCINAEYCMGNEPVDMLIMSALCDAQMISWIHESCEVVGNIYENTELTKLK